MNSDDMFTFLREKGFTPVSLSEAEKNLRIGLGLTRSSFPIAVVSTPTRASTPDTTPPVVTLNGDERIELYLGHSYTELNATATDNIDGNITSNIVIIGVVDTSVLGENNITYTVTDSAGNEGNVTRTITILSILKKTGQTTSYDRNGNVVADGTARDDGHYQKGTTPNYTRDDGNETVTDHLTGFMWQDDASVSSVKKPWITYDNYNAKNYFDTTGDTASTYCNELVLAGHEDWRLPTSVELESIFRYGTIAIDDTFVNIATGNSYYWSATVNLGDNRTTWIVDFNFAGGVRGFKENSYYIRCVRDIE